MTNPTMTENNSYTPPWRSVGHLLREQAARFSETTLFRFEGAEATFSQVEARTNQLANVLVSSGVRKEVATHRSKSYRSTANQAPL